MNSSDVLLASLSQLDSAHNQDSAQARGGCPEATNNTKYKYTAKMFVSCIPGMIKWLIKGGTKYILYFTHTIQCLASKIYQGTMKTEYRMPVD